jgi:hypothetical protein
VLAAGYINARTPHQARLQSYTRCLVLSLCLCLCLCLSLPLPFSASASALARLIHCRAQAQAQAQAQTQAKAQTRLPLLSTTRQRLLHTAPSPRLPHLPALCSLHDVTTAVPRLRPARHGLHAVSVPVRRRCPAASAVTAAVAVAVAVAVARLAVLGSRAPLSVACVACDSRPSRSFAHPLGAAWQPRLAIASSPLR